jgi:hypothetical protein
MKDLRSFHNIYAQKVIPNYISVNILCWSFWRQEKSYV